MIKEILLLTNLTHIFNFINSFVSHDHLDFIKFSVNKFLLCRDITKGFVKYSCKKCGHFHTFPISCKSKLSPTCGFKYSSVWASNMQIDILNIPHRHVLFTIPKELRMFFCYDRTLLRKLANAVNEIFKYQFHNMNKKAQRKKNIPKSSPNYFTDTDILHYGLVTIIHTFGRDLK